MSSPYAKTCVFVRAVFMFVSPYDIVFVFASVCMDCITAGQFDISSHYQRQKGKRLQGAAAITHTISKTRCYYASGVR